MRLAAFVTTFTLLAGLGSAAPVAADAPATLAPVTSYTDWLGERATAADLRGKVVLVDVFTFACYNCKNVTPNLRALYKSHRGDLAIVGVHTPETPYEGNRQNVTANLARQGIVWPVAIDNQQTLWNDYGVDAWPTQLIFDRHGNLRKTIVGDSQDADVNAEIDKLLAEK